MHTGAGHGYACCPQRVPFHANSCDEGMGEAISQALPPGAAVMPRSPYKVSGVPGKVISAQRRPFQCSRCSLVPDCSCPSAHASLADDAVTAARPPGHADGSWATDHERPFHRSITGLPGVAPLALKPSIPTAQASPALAGIAAAEETAPRPRAVARAKRTTPQLLTCMGSPGPSPRNRQSKKSTSVSYPGTRGQVRLRQDR